MSKFWEKEIPILLHNGFNHDFNLMVEHLSEKFKEREFNYLGKNMKNM